MFAKQDASTEFTQGQMVKAGNTEDICPMDINTKNKQSTLLKIMTRLKTI